MANEPKSGIEELELDAPPAPPTPEPEPKPTPEPEPDLKAAVADLAAAARDLREPKVEPKPEPLSKEKIDEIWAVYDPEKGDKDFYKKFFRLNPEATQEEADAVKGVFAAVQEGFVKQSLTGARNFDKMMMDEIDKKYGPALEYVSKAEMRERQDRFYEAYPALKADKFSRIIDGVAKGIKDDEFEGESQYFKALADGAAELIKGVIPDFDLGKQQQPTGKTPKLPRYSVGGGGGAGKTVPGKPETTSDNKVNELEADWQG